MSQSSTLGNTLRGSPLGKSAYFKKSDDKIEREGFLDGNQRNIFQVSVINGRHQCWYGKRSTDKNFRFYVFHIRWENAFFFS